jgi:arabinofuranosyltransferase
MVLIAIVGASKLAFLCDDAFITFRYVANAREGHGLVWNAPPFQPVEGYTAFLWALVLWATWSWFGVEPPDSANVLSIACGVGLLLVTARAALAMRDRDQRLLPPVVALCALGVIFGNRTFLQWWTSGLETALFNLAFVAWVLLAFRSKTRRDTRWLATWSAAAAASALTRPDGLLLVAATAATACAALLQRERRPGQLLAGLLPLLFVLAHIAWRRWFYGEWLPNTYYAKVITPWPEAGLRYLCCFCFEHGAWLWLPITIVWLAVECQRGSANVQRALLDNVPAAVAVATVVAHAGYYVLRVGGDHFEYRVLSQLVPLGVLACAAMAARVANGVRLTIATVLTLGLASAVGWLHLALTRDMGAYGLQPLTPQLPAVVRPLVRWFDQQQMWLLFRRIGMRCSFHACVMHKFATETYPPMRITDPPDPFPMMLAGGVGVLGWNLRDCAILDLLGLNDWVVARTPVHDERAALVGQRLRPAVEAADADHNGYLDLDELRTAINQAFGSGPEDRGNDFILRLLMSIYSDEGKQVTLADAVAIGDVMNPEHAMAHDRQPPVGYFEAFEPNVTVENGVAIAKPRKVPMTAERIQAIEAEWREKIRHMREH